MLSWGDGGRLLNYGRKKSPWCVIESVSQEFTLFSPSGVPLRAKLNVTFRDAWTIEEQLQETPRESSDRTKLVQVKRGQTLGGIAWQQYDNPAQWRSIAEANDLDNPRLLTPGTAPEQAEPFADVLSDLDDLLLPAMTFGRARVLLLLRGDLVGSRRSSPSCSRPR